VAGHEEVSQEEEEDGYLLYLEYNAATHLTSVVILDAKDVSGAPAGADTHPLFGSTSAVFIAEGLTLVRISAQPEQFWSLITPCVSHEKCIR